jgi:hypothetical protein
MGQSTNSTEPLGPHGGLNESRRILARAEPITSVLQNVVELANRGIAKACDTSVTLLNADGATCVAHTGRLSRELDEVQYRCGDGPSLKAAESNEIVEVTDCRADERWPNYARPAIERGALSCLAIPIPLIQQGSAALTVYAAAPHAFDEKGTQLAVRHGTYVAAALAYMHALETLRLEFARDLDSALEHRGIIEQAKGILMERHRLTADQSFNALVDASQAANIKLRKVADELVTTGVFDQGLVEDATGQPQE